MPVADVLIVLDAADAAQLTRINHRLDGPEDGVVEPSILDLKLEARAQNTQGAQLAPVPQPEVSEVADVADLAAFELTDVELPPVAEVTEVVRQAA